jgi:hypothetical protein
MIMEQFQVMPPLSEAEYAYRPGQSRPRRRGFRHIRCRRVITQTETCQRRCPSTYSGHELTGGHNFLI